MAIGGGTRVVQVTNIAPQATKDQMQTLFGYLGKIEDIRLYPTIRDVSCPVQSRICYIKFMEAATVGIAQHMTNTVFIDRALIVIPIQNGEIPDEYFALEMTRNGTIVPGLCAGEPNLPPNVINSLTSVGDKQVILTSDPKLDMIGLPQYPPLPSNYDSQKIEEIRRTVLVTNLDAPVASDDLIDFLSAAGEVKYLRQCTRHGDLNVYMLVEFSEQPSVVEALQMNGRDYKGKPIQILHSTQAIIKPQAKSNEAAQQEIEEAMSRVKEAQNLISATIDPVIGMLSKEKRSVRRSRSRSRGRRRRSRSRSHSRRRSHSRHRRRTKSRSRSRDRRVRSKSKSGRRSRSRSRRSRSRRSRSKSRVRSSRKERDRRKSKDRRSRSREKSRISRDRDRSRERLRDRDAARSRDRGRDRDSKEKRSDKENSVDLEDKRYSNDKKISRSPSRPKYRSRSRDRRRSRSRDRRRSRSRGRRRSPSPRSSRRRSRSRSQEKKRDRKEKKRDRSTSRTKSSRNYDEEERGFDMDSNRRKTPDTFNESDHFGEKESEKSDNMDISNSP